MAIAPGEDGIQSGIGGGWVDSAALDGVVR